MSSHKIVHITLGKANPERQNGVNKVVFQLAHHQSLNGNKSSVWGITKSPVINYEARLFETRLFKDQPLKFSISKALKKMITSTPKEVMFHLHGAFLPQLYVVARYLKKNKLNYIYTPHGAYNTVAMERSSLKKKLYIALFEKYLVNNATFIHIIGLSEEKGIRSVFGDEVRIRLIPNGQSVEPTTIEAPSSNTTIHFGFMGRLDIKTKGIDLLLAGFSRFILSTASSAVLHIVGDGDDRAAIESMVSHLNLKHHVVFHGALFGEEKKRVLLQLHYFCLTSRNEGLPGVVLEALALGKPCIVSQETNMGAYVSSFDAGYCLESNNEHQIAATLSKAAKMAIKKDYHRQRENAANLIQREFDWNVISNNLILEYHAC